MVNVYKDQCLFLLIFLVEYMSLIDTAITYTKLFVQAGHTSLDVMQAGHTSLDVTMSY